MLLYLYSNGVILNQLWKTLAYIFGSVLFYVNSLQNALTHVLGLEMVCTPGVEGVEALCSVVLKVHSTCPVQPALCGTIMLRLVTGRQKTHVNLRANASSVGATMIR